MDLRRRWTLGLREWRARWRGDLPAIDRIRRKREFERLTGQVDLVTFDRDGIRWTVFASDHGVARTLYVDGGHQAAERSGVLRWLARHVPEVLRRSTIVDVGANLGTPCIPLARDTGCQVLAIEPMPDSFDLLERNVAQNGTPRPIRCRRAAVAARPGLLRMVWQADRGKCEVLSPGSRQGFGARRRGARVVEVPSLPLDALVAREGLAPTDVAFVWSDTQGFEREVVTSGSALWAAGVPLYVELWPAGLRVHGGVDAFVSEVERAFDRMVLRGELVDAGDAAPARPVSELRALVARLEGDTDVLLIPRAAPARA